MRLRCSNPDCHKALELQFSAFDCPSCGDLLELSMNGSRPDPRELKRVWRERRASDLNVDRSGVWRFREFLPSYAAGEVVSMAEGNCALLDAPRSAAFAGVQQVRFKHLGWNPTGCFKDLGMTVAVTEAKHRGAKSVACASTGNTAASMAAYAARCGLAARVYLPKGKVTRSKIAQSIDYGAELVEVDGNFDQAFQQMMAAADGEVYLLNSINPFRVEGQKTVMFELMEQLDWEPPDYIFVPGGNLGNSSAFGKALKELHAAGFISRVPKLVIVQASGANALVRTVASGRLEVVPQPHTRATAICIGAPRSWKKAMSAMDFTGGLVLDVTDEEISSAKRQIGRDGIGCEPASATTLAGIKRLRASGEIDSESTFVAILTGHVLKDPESIFDSISGPLAALNSHAASDSDFSPVPEAAVAGSVGSSRR